ncbi:MAG: hypothetical protein R2939_18255 [Kofleriaceae bacterium]
MATAAYRADRLGPSVLARRVAHSARPTVGPASAVGDATHRRGRRRAAQRLGHGVLTGTADDGWRALVLAGSWRRCWCWPSSASRGRWPGRRRGYTRTPRSRPSLGRWLPAMSLYALAAAGLSIAGWLASPAVQAVLSENGRPVG